MGFRFFTERSSANDMSGSVIPFLPINLGVPSGTVLGPVLFTDMVIKDMSPTFQSTLMTRYRRRCLGRREFDEA